MENKPKKTRRPSMRENLSTPAVYACVCVCEREYHHSETVEKKKKKNAKNNQN